MLLVFDRGHLDWPHLSLLNVLQQGDDQELQRLMRFIFDARHPGQGWLNEKLLFFEYFFLKFIILLLSGSFLFEGFLGCLGFFFASAVLPLFSLGFF